MEIVIGVDRPWTTLVHEVRNTTLHVDCGTLLFTNCNSPGPEYATRRRVMDRMLRRLLDDAVVLAGEPLDAFLLPVVEVFGRESLCGKG